MKIKEKIIRIINLAACVALNTYFIFLFLEHIPKRLDAEFILVSSFIAAGYCYLMTNNLVII